MHLIFVLVPPAFAEEKKYEVVNVKSFLNIRSGPGTIYSILRAIPNTEKNITIVESKKLAKSTWVKIKHNNEYGWVNQTYLKVSVSPTTTKKTYQHTHEKGYKEVYEEEQPLWFRMEGVYTLTNIAPIKGEGMDTHMLFQLESEQAKVLYDAIKTPAFIDKCTGAMAKKVGEMLCLHYREKEVEIVKREEKIKEIKESKNTNDFQPKIKDIYECHFSINIMQQKIQQGILCDNE
ncbi:MAG TPA: hypothetical protein ENJ33_05965 [Thiothrix sp.]|nr:hypothetical protein [Thiothrix sp.]